MRTLLFFGIMVLSNAVSAQFVDGNALTKWATSEERLRQKIGSDDDFWNSAQFMGYVQGAYDANRSFFCTPTEFTTRQLLGVASKYLKDNPQKWNLPGDKLVLLAISEAFPCPKAKK